MDHRTRPKFKTNLLWSIIFLDLVVHGLRYGGLAMSDLFRHGVLLILATIVLGLHRRVQPIPRPYLIVFGSVLLVALFQLIPLPEWLFAHLVPIKHRIVTATTGIFPEIGYTTEMSLTPDLHWLKLAKLVLDMYLILLLFMSPKPSTNVFRGWLYGFGFIVGFLAILAGRDLLPDHGFLANYHETFGGLVNRNHFSLLSVILMIFLWRELYESGGKIVLHLQNKAEVRGEDILSHVFNASMALIILVVVFAGFQYGWSRSGILLFILGHLIFVGLVSLSRLGMNLKVLPRLLTLLGVLMIVFLFLPLGAGLEKIYEQGLKDSKRLGYLKIGRDYLAEAQVLGAGLGAAESLVESVEIKLPEMTLNGRDFHNEYLQTLVELGYPGLLALLAFLTLIARDLVLDRRPRSEGARSFIFAVLSAVIVVAIHSIVAFPMMITSIKVFMILVVLLGLKTSGRQNRSAVRKRVYFLAFTPFLIAATLYFYFAASFVPQQGETLPEVQRATKYGYFYRIPFFVANEEVGRFFIEEQDNETIREQIPRIRPLLYRHLEQNPFSIKALNLLFILEAMEDRIERPAFDQETFLVFREKAEAIRALGKDANIHAKSSLMFLLSLNKGYLSEADEAELQTLLDYSQWSLRRGQYEMRKKQEKIKGQGQDSL